MKKLALAIGVFALLMPWLPSTFGANRQPVISGSYSTGQKTMDVAVKGQYAYLCNGDEGLTILDIKNPSTPNRVQTIDTTGYAHGISIHDHFAFIADGNGGLQIIDIQDPQSAANVSAIKIPGYAYAVTVSEFHAYVANGLEGGLVIIDITDPTSPQISGTLVTPGIALDISLYGSYAYLADGNGGLVIVDILDITAPKIIEQLDLLDKVQGVSVKGSYAYLAVGESGMMIVNIEDKENPEVISRISAPDIATKIAVLGTYAYVTNWRYGLQIFNILNPLSPVIEHTLKTSGHAMNLTVNDAHVYLADWDGGLQIITTTEAPQIIYASATPGTISNDSSAYPLITAQLVDANGLNDILSVFIDLSRIGGNPSQVLYDNGTNGDAEPSDGIFNFQTTVIKEAPIGKMLLKITAIDRIGLKGFAYVPLNMISTINTSVTPGSTAKHAITNTIPNQSFDVSVSTQPDNALQDSECKIEFSMYKPDGTLYNTYQINEDQVIQIQSAEAGTWQYVTQNPCSTERSYQIQTNGGETGVIIGRVWDLYNGLGISGVTLTDAFGSTTTSVAEGYFVGSMAPGTTQITATKEGYQTHYQPDVKIKVNEVTPLDLRLAPLDNTDLSQIEIRLYQVDTSYCPFIYTYFTVKDSRQNHIYGLEPANFILTDSENPIENFEIFPPNTHFFGMSIVFALDFSASIQNDYLPLKSMLIDFIDHLTNDDMMEIIKFNDEVVTAQSFTSDKTTLKEALSGEPSGKTALYDGLYQAVYDIGGKEGRKMVIVIANGIDTRSDHTFKQVVDQAVYSKVPIISVDFKTNVASGLEQYAIASEGQYYFAESIAAMDKVLEEILQIFQTQYLAAYTTYAIDEGSHLLAIKVQTPTGNGQNQKEFTTCAANTILPAPPRLKINQSESRVTLSWNKVQGEPTGYILYFAPFPDADYIADVDLGLRDSISFELESQSAFYVVLQAYNATGKSDYSNVAFFILP